MISPEWMGSAILPVGAARTGRDAAGRRSMATTGLAGNGSGFRRLDVPMPWSTSVDGRSAAGRGLYEGRPKGPQGHAKDQSWQPDASQRRAAVASDRPGGRRADEAASASDRAGSAGLAEVTGTGLPRVLTAGRTALLAGTLSVFAQLFGQQLAATLPTAHDVATVADQARPVPSTLELRTGHAVYRSVNRLVGAESLAPFVAGSVEIMDMPGSPRGPVVDAVA